MGRFATIMGWVMLFALTGTLSPVRAQVDRGTIEGIVTDPSGASVAQAKVQIVHLETNDVIQLATNSVGRYFAPNLPLGSYRVVIEKEGFRTAVREPIQVRAQISVNADFALEVGSVRQRVEVTSTAPMLDSSATTLSTSLAPENVDGLIDINIGEKRNITDYLQYLPGTTTGNDTWDARVYGGTPGETEVYIDGAPASQMISRGSLTENGPQVEDVAEFSVITDAYNAEYGRAGTWFSNVTIKSGNNQLHGTAYEHFANNVLNARGFFAPTTPIFRQNEGGANVGGPVYIPGLYDGRNKTFFFFGQGLYWFREARLGNPETIPTEAFRQGDFSNLLDANGNQIPIFDPATTQPDGQGGFVRTQFPGNIIPPSRISSVAAKIDALMPTPDNGAEYANWYNRTGAPPTFDTRISTVKVDHSFRVNQKISGMYSAQHRPRVINGSGWGVSSPLEGAQDQSILVKTGRINYDWIARSNLLNHLTLGIDYYGNTYVNSTAGQGWQNKLGITNMPYSNGAMPYFVLYGGTASPITISEMSNGWEPSGRYTVAENLAWIRGHHSLKFGGEYYLEYSKQWERFMCNGNFWVSNTMTSQPDSPNFGAWGSSFASFLLGDMTGGMIESPTIINDMIPYWGFFGQDEWRVNKKFTLSYGLRWDYTEPARSEAGQTANFDPTTPNPGAGGRLGSIIFNGYGPGDTGKLAFANPWHRGFAPRLGMAYQLTPKTILRASSGIYYGMNERSWLFATPTQGYQISFRSADNFTAPFNIDNGFPAFTAPVNTPTAYNGGWPNWVRPDSDRAPQTLTWTFSIQRQLTPNMALDISYLGSHSTHLFASGSYLADPNYVNSKYLSLGSLLTQPFNSPAAVAAGIQSPFTGFQNYGTDTVAQALKPYPQYVGIWDVDDAIGDDKFESLTVKLTKRFSHGLTLLAFYEWSKNLTDVESGPGFASIGFDSSIQYPGNYKGEMAESDLDTPHMVQVNGTYQLPFGPGQRFLTRSGPIGKVIGGWQFAAILERGSGLPLTIYSSDVLSYMGYPGERANLVSGQPIHLHTNSGSFNPATDRFLNPAAFSIPGTYQLGNTARTLDYARGWGSASEEVSLSKRTHVTERVSTVMRLDVSNPFNFVRWSNPDSTITDAAFGEVFGSAPGRIAQISLSVEF
jgi:hypothetical protein